MTGEDVRILAEDGHELSGRVDIVAQEGEILWLHLSSGAGRKLFLHQESAAVWRVPSHEKDAESLQSKVV